MSPDRITPELVRGLWKHLQAHFGTVTIPKERSPLMRAVGRVLDAGGILDRDGFMDRFTTVIDRRIYAPFEVGDPEGASLFGQLDTGIHEHQHVVQIERDGRLRMWSSYLGSSRQRALYEAEAYTCGIELSWWVHGRHAEPAWIAATLQHYGCSRADIEAATEVLAANAERVRAGETVTESMAIARPWLEAHAG